jgi:glutamine synthetase
MHEDVEKCAKLLTSDGAAAMAGVREICDRLELVVADELWPLPKYREMLFPV